MIYLERFRKSLHNCVVEEQRLKMKSQFPIFCNNKDTSKPGFQSFVMSFEELLVSYNETSQGKKCL